MQTIASRLIKGIMLLPATADGQEGYFAFDTGAMQTAVNRAYFPELQGDTIEIAKFTEGVKKTNAEGGHADDAERRRDCAGAAAGAADGSHVCRKGAEDG